MPMPDSKYRPDIDGLRAVAVLGVLLFHLDGHLLGGGYIGVDVFFVISGFLITSIIDREAGAGNFSFLRFYERRIRRIIPALFVMILAAWAIALNTLLPADLIDFTKSVRYTVFSASNFFFMGQSEDYFADGVEQMPLLHTWSLGVEEQFYIVFPVLLLLGHRYLKSAKQRILMILALGLISFFASQWVVKTNPDGAFYLLPWRAWELLLGSLLAMMPLPKSRGWQDHILGATGLALIVGGMVRFSESTVFPGYAAAVPCVGAVLVIFAGREGKGLAARLLSLKPVTFIGLISYSIYLWHWPLIAFTKYTFRYDAPMPVILFFASIILGWLSWYLVERPFRGKGFGGRGRVYASWAGASLLLLIAGSVVAKMEGLPNRFSPEVLQFLRPGAMIAKYRAKSLDTYDPKLATIFGDESQTPSMALWGDSHAGALLPVLDALGRDHHRSLRAYDMPSQPPMTGVTRIKLADRKKRAAYSDGVLAALTGDPNIHVVILHARWASYTRSDESGERPPQLLDHPFKTIASQRAYVISRLNDVVATLLKAGKKVVLVYPVPEIESDVPDYLAKLAAARETVPFEIENHSFQNYNESLVAALDHWKDQPGVTIIQPDTVLMKDGRMKIRIANELLYHDNDHLSPAGADHLRSLFEAVFNDPATLR
jgi:peptidoglycan/LPS O-acetylase OafA/YrhL